MNNNLRTIKGAWYEIAGPMCTHHYEGKYETKAKAVEAWKTICKNRRSNGYPLETGYLFKTTWVKEIIPTADVEIMMSETTTTKLVDELKGE